MDLHELQSKLVGCHNLLEAEDGLFDKEKDARIELKKLERIEKMKFAKIALDLDGAQILPEHKLKTLVYSNKDWVDYLDALDTAEAAHITASSALEKFKLNVDILRSLNSINKNHFNSY